MINKAKFLVQEATSVAKRLLTEIEEYPSLSYTAIQLSHKILGFSRPNVGRKTNIMGTFVKNTKFYIDDNDLNCNVIWYLGDYGEIRDYPFEGATPALFVQGMNMYPEGGMNISRPAKERVAHAIRIVKAYMDGITMYCEVLRGCDARVLWETGAIDGFAHVAGIAPAFAEGIREEGNSDFRANEFMHIVLGGNAKNVARDARMLEKETARAVSKGVAFTGYASQSARFSVHPRLRVMRARKVATNLWGKKVPTLVSNAPTYGANARNPRWELVGGVS